MSGHGGGWQEVGERVFRFRYRSMDLNVGAVLGDGEVLVVDTAAGRPRPRSCWPTYGR